MTSNAGSNFLLSDEQYQTMSAWFTKYEKDGDGQLNLAELRELVAGVTGINSDEELDRRANKLMEKLDNDGSKTLGFNEFIRGYERMLKAAAQGDGSGMGDFDLLNITKSAKKGSGGSDSNVGQNSAQISANSDKNGGQLKELQENVKRLTEEKEKLLSLNNILMKRIKDTASKSFEGEMLDQSQENSKLRDENSNLKRELEELRGKSQSDSKSADSISYTFRWPYGGENPSVGGQWNDWKNEKMQKDEASGEYFLKVDGLKPNTRYLYKYHVGGQWKEDLTAPTDDSEKVDGRNVINNILVTDSAEKDVRISNLERERDQLFRRNRTLEEEKKNSRPDEKLEERIKQLEKELSAMKELNTKELGALKNEREQNSKNSQERERLEKELNDLKNSLKNSQESEEKSRKLEEDLRNTLKNLEELNSKSARLEEELKAALKNSEESAKVAQELKSSQERVAKLEEELKNSAKNTQESSQLSQQNSKLSQELKESQEKSARLEDELKKIQSKSSEENSKVAQELKNTQEKVARLEEELKNSNKNSQESSQLSQQNSKLAQELKESQERSARLEDELKKSQSKSSEESSKAAQELKNSQERVAKLEEELKNSNKKSQESAQSAQDSVKLSQELKESQEKSARLEGELKKAQEESKKVQQQLAQVTEELSSKLKESKDLQQKVTESSTQQMREIEAKSKEAVEAVFKKEKEAQEQIAAAEQRLAVLKADIVPLLTYLIQAQISLRSNLNTLKAYQKTSVQGDLTQVAERYKAGQQLTERIATSKELQRQLNLLPSNLVENYYKAELKDLELREAGASTNNNTIITLGLTIPALIAAGYVFLKRRSNN